MIEPDVIAAAKELRKKGFNIIPVHGGSKIQAGTPEEIALWKTENCKKEIEHHQNIGIQYGKCSGYWALDLDDPGLLEELIVDENKRKRMMIVKTGQKGHHLIYKIIEGDEPPGDIKLFDGIVDKKITAAKHDEDKDDKKLYNASGIALREIDVRIKGYTICPPSIHPDTKIRYEFLNEDFDVPPLGWSDTASKLDALSFKQKDEAQNYLDTTVSQNYSELIIGGFSRGERRPKLRSLYIKIRMHDYKKGINEEESKKQAAVKYREINKTCIPNLEEKEVSVNIPSAEDYFQNTVKPDMDKKKIKMSKIDMKEIENAKLADEVINRFCFIATVPGELWFYKESDGLFHKHGDDLLGTELINQQRTPGDIENITKIVHHRTKIRPDNVGGEDGNEDIFNRDWTKINTRNSVIDLKTGEIMEFSAEHRNTIGFPINYNPDAKCKRFNEFLKSSLDNDERKIIWIKEMMASCLIKKNLTQRGYVLHGRGANGKGTILRTLTNLLGLKNTTSAATLSTIDDSRFIGFDLHGKAASIAGDGGTEKIEKTGKIKKILGGDSLVCEEKYRNSFPYFPFATMIFTFNELPEVNDSSDGFNRKIQPIHFTKSFYGDKANDNLGEMENDPEELSGILNELIPICKRLIETKKLTNPYTVDESKREWTMLENAFYIFSTSQLELVSNQQVGVNVVFEKFLAWCKEQGFVGLERRVFIKKMDDLLRRDGERTKTRTKTRINEKTTEVFLGVCLKRETGLKIT